MKVIRRSTTVCEGAKFTNFLQLWEDSVPRHPLCRRVRPSLGSENQCHELALSSLQNCERVISVVYLMWCWNFSHARYSVPLGDISSPIPVISLRFVCMCVQARTCTPQCICVCQRTPWSGFSPCTMWVPGIKLRLSDLAAGTFTP